MLRVICPKDGTIHQADSVHTGKLLRCAKCGEPVQIGATGESGKTAVVPSLRDERLTARLSAVTRSASAAFRLRFPNNQRASIAGTLLLCGVLALVYFGEGRKRLSENESHKSLLASAPFVAPPNPQPTEILSVHTQVPAPSGGPSAWIPMADEPIRPSAEATARKPRKLPTGSHITPSLHNDGHGLLTIDNLGGEDAEVKVISISDQLAVRHVYVEHGTRIDLTKLRPGAYKVLFSVGDDWDSEVRGFLQNTQFFAFGKSLGFKESKLSDAVEYSHHTITLYPQADGTVERVVISKKVFEGQ